MKAKSFPLSGAVSPHGNAIAIVASVVCAIGVAFGAAAEVSLPRNYTSLEYIEATGLVGRQYINTQYNLRADDKVECDVNITDDATKQSYYPCLFGSKWGNSTDGFLLYLAYYLSNEGLNYGRGSWAELSDSRNLRDKRIVITCQGNTASWSDGTSGGTGSVSGSLGKDTSIPMLIFQQNAASVANGVSIHDNWWAAAKLYGLTITDADGILQRDFVPCRNENGEAGLWDRAFGGFYANQGSGDPFVGSDGEGGTPLPEDYTQLEYIEATGLAGRQYINTRHNLKADDKVECGVNITDNASWQSYYPCLFGSKWNNTTDGFLLYLANYTVNVGLNYGRGTMTELTDSRNLRGKRIVITCQGKTASWSDGTTGGEATVASVGNNTSIPMLIFQQNAANVAGGVAIHDNWWAAAKLYGLTITDANGVAKRDFVPCRNARGEAGLWDLVFGGFYANQGTKDPFVGSDSDTEAGKVAFIESTGLGGKQYINTGYNHKASDQVVCDVAITDDATKQGVFSCLFGSKWNNDRNAFLLYCTYSSTKGLWYGRANIWSMFRNADAVRGKRIVITCQGGNANYLGSDGTTGDVVPISGIGGDGAIPMLIFQQNYAKVADGVAIHDNWWSAAKLYRFDISSADGTPQRKLVPWRKADGTVCLYDHVTKRTYDNIGLGTFGVGGEPNFHYTVNSSFTTLELRRGTLDDVEIIPCYETVEKTGPYAVDVTAATQFKDLVVSQGRLSFADGEVDSVPVRGLTLRGGVTLEIDATASAADCLVVQSLALDGSATADNPVHLDVRLKGGLPESSVDLPLVTGARLAASDESRFELQLDVALPENFSAAPAVANGDLVLRVLTPVRVATSEWIGGDATDVTDMANWHCLDAYGQEIFGTPLMTEETVCTFSGVPKFDITRGMQFVCRELVVTEGFALDGDRDWSGLSALRIGENVTIDEAGFTFKLPAVVTGASSVTSKFAGEQGAISSFTVDTGVSATSGTFAVENPLALEKAGPGELTIFDLGGQPALNLAAGRLNLAWTGEPPENPFASVAVGGAADTTIDLGGASQSIARSGLPHRLHMRNGTYAFTGTDRWMLDTGYKYYVEAGANVTVAGPFYSLGGNTPTITVDGGELHFTSTTASTLGDRADKAFVLDVKNSGLVQFAASDFVLGNQGGLGRLVVGSSSAFDARGRTVYLALAADTAIGELDVSGGSTFAADTVQLGGPGFTNGRAAVTVANSTFEVGHILQAGPLGSGASVTFNGATLVPAADGTLLADYGEPESAVFHVGANGLCVSNAYDKAVEIAAKMDCAGELTFVDPRRVTLGSGVTASAGVAVRFTRNPTRTGRVIGWDAANPPATVTVEGLPSNYRFTQRADGLYVGQGLIIMLK